MKLLDLWDALAGDGGQPWPADALFEVEGLNYHEALGLLKMHQAGEELPSYDRLREVIAEREAAGYDLATKKGKTEGSKVFPLLVKAVRRKAMAAALGVTDPREQGELARAAGAALDRVATAAKKAGVQLDLSRRGSRRGLLDVAMHLVAVQDVDNIAQAILLAQNLIAAVNIETR